MKNYSMRKKSDTLHIIYGFHILDSCVFIRAACGDPICARIVLSQDETPIKYVFPLGVEGEVIDVLLKNYNGEGVGWIYDILKTRNFARIFVRHWKPSYLGWLDEKDISNVDKDIIKLSHIQNAKCTVSCDFDLVGNPKYRSSIELFNPKFKIYLPDIYVKIYNDDLITLDEDFVKLTKKRLEEDRRKIEEGLYPPKKELFNDLWLIEY